MEQFVGLDVSQQLTHICVVDREGGVVWRGTCLSTPEEIAATVRIRAPHAVRIGLETGPLSTWHWHALKKMGLPVICIDARHAKAALSMQVNKTDRNDAFGLAQIMRTGWYREVGAKASRTTRSALFWEPGRSLLVRERTYATRFAVFSKYLALSLKRAADKSFEARVSEVARGNGDVLELSLQTLMATLKVVREQVEKLDRMAIGLAKQNPICRHLMSIPGVGPLTAVAFVTTVEDPGKFRKSRNVGAFFGLTPKRYQSGETDVSGRISKWGDPLVRAYLYEAANVLLTSCKKWSALKAWGMRIAKRSGMKKAKVAVARKLAVIMHQMWTTGE